METEQLVTLADAFAKHRNLSRSTVSTYAANDGKLMDRLAAGAGCTIRRAHILIRWFDENWPADLEWPREIQRPAKSKRAA